MFGDITFICSGVHGPAYGLESYGEPAHNVITDGS